MKIGLSPPMMEENSIRIWNMSRICRYMYMDQYTPHFGYCRIIGPVFFAHSLCMSENGDIFFCQHFCCHYLRLISLYLPFGWWVVNYFSPVNDFQHFESTLCLSLGQCNGSQIVWLITNFSKETYPIRDKFWIFWQKRAIRSHQRDWTS